MDKNNKIIEMYKSGNYLTEQIAKEFNVNRRTIQRIVKKHGEIRTQSESNKLMAKYKAYYKKPEHLKFKRKQITSKLRYQIIRDHPFCATCGSKPLDGVRLEVDHIDNNPSNNNTNNLQVLCCQCNIGKLWLQ